MKTLILLLFLLFWGTFSQAQIQYDGCSGAIVAGLPAYIEPTGTVGHAIFMIGRGTCGCSGACTFRIIWTGTAWEIQVSQDGGATFPIVLYRNTSASSPNPPDLTLGTWVDVSGSGCGPISTLSGDVQSSLGGSSAPEINITGNGNTILDGDVTPRAADGTNFGNVNLINNSVRTFVIDNSAGTGTLTISSIVITGAQAGDFAISGAPTTIAAGGNASFNVTFSPLAVGLRNATVVINNNDTDESVYDFSVRGNGVTAPEISLLGNATGIVDGDVTPSPTDGTDFGTVLIGNNTPQLFSIDNVGNAPLTISNIVVTGAQAGDFVVSGAPTTVAAGNSATFTLTFTPAAAGFRTATVTINNNDADEAAYDFAVRGQGITAPEINITGNGTTILAGDLTPSTADGSDFGNILVSTSDPQVFVIDNSAGSGILTITAVAVSGPQAAEFVVAGVTFPLNIAAGGNASFTLTFTPSTIGLREATVTINNNDANEAVYDFAVQGTGVALPSIAITEWISDPSVDDATDEWVELYNYGTVAVDLQNWRLRDEDTDNALITSSSYLIQPGDYVILARNKVSFEVDWLACPDPRVLQVAMILGNTTDEIILEDNNGNIIWSLAYGSDRSTGNATFYTENNYTPRVWGSKASPGIDRAGNDPATGTLGYERNNTTSDPNARFALNGDLGSPFDGNANLAEIIRGDALEFSAPNEYVQAANPADFDIGTTVDLTLEAWIKPTNNSNRVIMTVEGAGAGASGYTLYLDALGALSFEFLSGPRSDRLRSSTSLAINQWHHVAATLNRATNTLILYVNGVAIDTFVNTNFSFSASFPSNNFYISSRLTTNGFEGSIDEVRVWRQVRSATEIRENLHLTLSGCETNLAAYYQFNNGTGATVVTDATGGNNGTLTNMDPATDWVTSDVNVGNDINASSNSQTLPITTGAGTFNFANANATLAFTAHSIAEDMTVTYEAFTPNAITGITGTSITQNPMWTINKATNTSTQTYNITFTLPTATFNTAGKDCNFRLYNRPMYADDTWTAVALEASSFTSTTVTFEGISAVGQFLLVEDPADAPTLTRGRALEFDGNNDQIIIGNVQELTFDFNDAYTLEAWIKIPVGTTTNGQILSKFDGNALVGYTFGYLGGTGEVNFGITNFNTFEFFEVRSATGFDIRDDEWHHIAMSYSGSGNAAGVDLYIDGVRSTRVALSGTVTTSVNTTAPAVIGNYSAGTEFFTGQMDKLTVWNRKLTANEIREGMHLTFDGCENNLVAYYQMNESPGSVILPDLAGGSNGTLVSMNVITAWVTSTVNLGNDAAGTSNSETILVPAGASNQNFANANLDIQFNSHSVPENYTVTYEAFTPNAITGVAGSNILQDPMWTVNKETGTSIQSMDLVFTFPANTFSVTSPCAVQLYNRPMNSDGAWTLLTNSASVTPNTASFANITTTGQFMLVEETNAGGDLVRGDALDFDGIDDYVSIPNTPAFNPTSGAITLECWARANNSTWGGTNGFAGIVTHRGGTNLVRGILGVTGTTSVDFFIDNASVRATVADITELHHYAGVYDGTTLFFYVDGQLAGQTTHTTGILNYTDDLYIGRDNCCGGRNLNGQVDEVRVWNQARTETAIRENMHLTLSGCESSLLAYYQMNAGTGATTVVDKTGKGNTGTLVNMDPATDWVPSGVNVGNDILGASNSQSRTMAAATGSNPTPFTAANLILDLIDNTTVEDYTVTYEAFTPNTIDGVTGTNILQNPMWTVNKATDAPAPRMNLEFQFPAGTFTQLDGTKYRLYWRPMYADGDWIIIKNYARVVNSNSIQFSNIYETGQFMVVQASESLISDVRGEMYDFGGSDEYIEIPNTINVPGDWTTELWFKSAGSNNFENILHTDFPSADQGFRVELSNNFPNGQLYFSIATSNTFRPHTIVPLGGTLNANEWYHLTIVGDRTNNRVRAYLNGILLTDEVHTDWPNSFPAIALGRGFSTANDRDFNGSLDEVRFWNSARTQNEIRENMHLTLKGTEADIISYYQFNDDLAVGTSNGVIDAMGINNGTTVNMTTANYVPSEVAVAGGVSERMTVTSTGLMNFSVPKTAIDFTSNPDGEIVVSRLMTEKPHGWESITGDVDNEYFVVWNYGNNPLPIIGEMTFNELSYFVPATLASEVGLYKRGSRQFGPTWGTAIAPASTITRGNPSSATFAGAPLTVGFSQLVIAQTGTVGSLPIELIRFEAERANRQEVQLRWATAIERNNKGFEVERLLEGETAFVNVGYVDGKGTTTNLSTYYLVDPNSFTGISYYRLKQIDLDGSIQYSPTRAVAGLVAPSGDGMTVFPNPTAGALNFQILEPLAPTPVHIRLTDAQGRVVREHSLTISSEQVVSLPHLLTDLPSNLYFLQVTTTDGQLQWSKKISLR